MQRDVTPPPPPVSHLEHIALSILKYCKLHHAQPHRMIHIHAHYPIVRTLFDIYILHCSILYDIDILYFPIF